MKTDNYFYSISILVLLLCLSLGACGQALQVTAVPTEAAKSVSAEVVERGVRMRISADKDVYQPGEIVNITVSVENLADNPAVYVPGGIGAPAILVYLDKNPYRDTQPLYEQNCQPKAVLDVVTEEVL